MEMLVNRPHTLHRAKASRKDLKETEKVRKWRCERMKGHCMHPMHLHLCRNTCVDTHHIYASSHPHTRFITLTVLWGRDWGQYEKVNQTSVLLHDLTQSLEQSVHLQCVSLSSATLAEQICGCEWSSRTKHKFNRDPCFSASYLHGKF